MANMRQRDLLEPERPLRLASEEFAGLPGVRACAVTHRNTRPDRVAAPNLQQTPDTIPGSAPSPAWEQLALAPKAGERA